MKLIRLILISILVLFVLASLVGTLMPSTVLVSRAINVSAEKDSVKPYLNNIEQWKAWMEGMDNNTAVKIYSSSRAMLGKTTVEITGITDSTVISLWTPATGSKQLSTIRLISDSIRRVTVVQWQFEQKVKWYPWEKLGSIMNDKILGTMMEKNLNDLKTLVEKK